MKAPKPITTLIYAHLEGGMLLTPMVGCVVLLRLFWVVFYAHGGAKTHLRPFLMEWSSIYAHLWRWKPFTPIRGCLRPSPLLLPLLRPLGVGEFYAHKMLPTPLEISFTPI